MAKAIQVQETTAVADISPPAMLQQALASGASIEVMERFMEMTVKWEAVQARKAFDNAIAELRGKLPDIVKTREGHNYKYEALSDIVKAISPPMAELGLSFRWRTDAKDGMVIVTCIVSHREGHSEETSLPSPPDTSGSKNAIQALGSAVTYLQRYTLKAAIGIAAAHDDDGQSADKQGEAEPSKAKSRDKYTDLVAVLRAAKTVSELESIWDGFDWRQIPKDWHKTLQDESRTIGDSLRNEVNNSTSQTAEDSLARQFPDNGGDGDFPGDMPFEQEGPDDTGKGLPIRGEG